MCYLIARNYLVLDVTMKVYNYCQWQCWWAMHTHDQGNNDKDACNDDDDDESNALMRTVSNAKPGGHSLSEGSGQWTDTVDI